MKISSLCEDINERKKEHTELTDEISDYKHKTDTLSKQKSDYIVRFVKIAIFHFIILLDNINHVEWNIRALQRSEMTPLI